MEHACGALFLEPGLGKTTVAMAAFRFLRDRGLASRALIVAPLRVCQLVWPAEREKWEDFSDLRMVVLHGPDKDELIREDAELFVINPDGLPWLMGLERERRPTGKVKVTVDAKRWRGLELDTLIVDELSKFKDSGTQRFKAIRQVLGSFGRRWGMTGSPSPNGLGDLFGQMYVIDEGRSLGRYVSHYRSRYFTPAWDGYGFDLRDGADREIFKRVKPVTLSMEARDYLDLPKLVERTVEVELPKEARRVYDELEEDLISRIADGVVVAANAAVASMKCRQVANGGIYLDPEVRELVRMKRSDREWVDLHEEKSDAIADLAAELQGKPLLVAYDFEHDLVRLRAALGKDVPHIGGGVTGKRAAAIERAWNAGKVPILLGHPQSIAHGLNLQGAGCHVAWHSLTWNYELYDQFIRRVLRQGQRSRKVFVHHVVARDTVDVTILAALRSKESGQRALFAALKSRVAARKPRR